MSKADAKKILGIILISILFYLGVQRLDLVVMALKFIWKLFFPFVMGGVIAFIFSVPMRGIEKRLFNQNVKLQPLKRPIAYVITLLGITFTLFMALFILVPELANTVELLMEQIQEMYFKIPEYIDVLTKNAPQVEEYINELGIDWAKLSQNAIKTVQTAFSGVLNSGTWLVKGIISGVTTFILSFIFSIYILFSQEKLGDAIKRMMRAFLPQKKMEQILYVAGLSNKVFSSFLSGQCLEAVILGSIFFIVMSLLKIPYALLISVVISITALVPIFGAFIGCVIGMFLIVMVNPMQAVWFLVLFLIIQQLENNLIYPHVVGSSIGLPSILVFISVIVGGNLMGVAGMLVFIPASSVVYTLVKEYIDLKIKEKNSLSASE